MCIYVCISIYSGSKLIWINRSWALHGWRERRVKGWQEAGQKSRSKKYTLWRGETSPLSFSLSPPPPLSLSVYLSIYLSLGCTRLQVAAVGTSESKRIVVRCNEELYFSLNLSLSFLPSLFLRVFRDDELDDYSDNDHAQLKLYRSRTGMQNILKRTNSLGKNAIAILKIS